MKYLLYILLMFPVIALAQDEIKGTILETN